VLGKDRPDDQAASQESQQGAGQAEQGAGPGQGRGRAGMPAMRVIALVAAAAAVAAAGGAYALTHAGTHASAAEAAMPRLGQHDVAAGGGALRVVSVTPATGARNVNGADMPVTVTFSAQLAANSATPRLSPAVNGQWQQTGASMVFTPSAPFPPSAKITVRVPAGLRSASGGLLAQPLATHFSTVPYSALRLGEILSQLGYMPMSWTPAGGQHVAIPESGPQPATVTGQGTGILAQAAMAESPPAGKFTWDNGYPSMLRSQWQPNQANLIEKGALMAFESQHGMTLNGTPSPKVWDALFQAADKGQDNHAGYTYAIASKSAPETLTIWHDGRRVMRSLANTGVPVAPTVDGTFPVYLRYRFQVMSGTNPDGSSYADPVSFVSYFNGGDAVHYFPRGAYGFQQSLGCVELPYSSAEEAWPYLTYGSLVTVAG
jgi:hypothetical protein